MVDGVAFRQAQEIANLPPSHVDGEAFRHVARAAAAEHHNLSAQLFCAGKGLIEVFVQRLGVYIRTGNAQLRGEHAVKGFHADGRGLHAIAQRAKFRFVDLAQAR